MNAEDLNTNAIKLGVEVGSIQTGTNTHKNRIYWIISKSDMGISSSGWRRSPPFCFMDSNWNLFLYFDVRLRNSEKWAEMGVVCSSANFLSEGLQIKIGIEGSNREISKRFKLDNWKHFFKLLKHNYLEPQNHEWLFQDAERLRQRDEWFYEENIRLFFSIEKSEDDAEVEMPIQTNVKIVKDGHDEIDNSVLEETSSTAEEIGIQKLQQDLKRIFQNGYLTDVVLKVDSQEFKSHRSILAARSPVFLAMLTHDTMEKKTGIVDIQDIDPTTFSDFLNYLYTGSLEWLTSDNASNLYTTADRYQVNDLKKLCLDHMLKNISVENFCDILVLSLQHVERDLTEACYLFFAKNSLNIVLTPKWQVFLSENPIAGNELYIKQLQLNK